MNLYSQAFDYIMKDLQHGRGICNGVKVVSTTSSNLDVRFPLKGGAVPCGWLILPAWFYPPKNKALAPKEKTTSGAPFLASLRFNDKHACSGALISPQHVLTTASCLLRLKGLMKAEEANDQPQNDAHHKTCSPKIKEFYTGTPEDPNYDHLSTVQHVSVLHWPNKDNCQHVIAQGNGQDYFYQFLFHCDTLEMTHAQYWKHTNEYAWKTFNHESCIPEGETQACGGDPCLICKEVAKEEEALGEVTHKCHVDFSKPECGQQSFPAEVTYSPALLDACFPAATVEIEDDSAPSSTGCCYEFKKFKDGRQESYCFESSKTIGSQAECPEGSQ